MKSIVIALGGNALLDPSGRQSFAKENKNINRVSRDIARLCKDGDYRIVITHGNGSQVGDEVLRNEHAKKYVPKLPLYVLNAETQALIGTVVETALRNNLILLGIKRDVCVILAHVLVERNDRAFKRPTKQVGPFYDKKELDKELKLEKFNYIKSGSKYRRVVASPKPREILEVETIRDEFSKKIIVTCGGGGVPTIKSGKGLSGINAVIDKDLTSQLLANSIKAESLVILTNADYIYADYKKKKGKIKKISARILRKNLDKFEEGTIRPKVEACINFVENGGKEAYIGNVYKLDSILKGSSGTKITL